MNPPILPEQEAAILARERLRLLSLGYYISGGIGAIFASLFFLEAAMFFTMSFLPMSDNYSPARSHNFSPTMATIPSVQPNRTEPNEFPVAIFRFFSGLMLFVVAVGWTLSGLTIYSGHCLQKRKYKLLICIVAGINMIWIPYGTLLGIATFLTINADSVKEEFRAALGSPAV